MLQNVGSRSNLPSFGKNMVKSSMKLLKNRILKENIYGEMIKLKA